MTPCLSRARESRACPGSAPPLIAVGHILAPYYLGHHEPCWNSPHCRRRPAAESCPRRRPGREPGRARHRRQATGPDVLTGVDLVAPAALRPVLIAALATEPGQFVLAVTATGREAEDLAAALAVPAPTGSPVPGLGDAAARAAVAALRHGRPAGWPCCAGWPTRTRPTRPPGRCRSSSRRSAACCSRSSAAWATWSRSGCGRATTADPDELLTRLVGDRLRPRATWSSKRGEFAVRGGILDVFPPTDEHPVRVEFFGDTVEEIRSFKVADQRSLADAPARPVGAAVPRAAAHRPRCGTRAARARRSSPAWPTCSASWPTASRSRAWSRSRRCSSTRMELLVDECPPERTCVRLRPGAGPDPRRTTRRHQPGVPRGVLGRTPPAGGDGPDRPRRGRVPVARRDARGGPGSGAAVVDDQPVRASTTS